MEIPTIQWNAFNLMIILLYNLMIFIYRTLSRRGGKRKGLLHLFCFEEIGFVLSHTNSLSLLFYWWCSRSCPRSRSHSLTLSSNSCFEQFVTIYSCIDGTFPLSLSLSFNSVHSFIIWQVAFFFVFRTATPSKRSLILCVVVRGKGLGRSHNYTLIV